MSLERNVESSGSRQTNSQTNPVPEVRASIGAPGTDQKQQANHMRHSFDLVCQNRGRYGPKQHLVECTGNTGSNLLHIRGLDNNPPVPVNENGENKH